MAGFLSHHYIPWVVGFGYAVLAGHFLVFRLRNTMAAAIRLEPKGPPWQPEATGLVERALFTASILTSNAAFIGVWLALKSVAGWSAWTENHDDNGNPPALIPGRAIFVNFMIGSGVSIGLAAAGAYATKLLLHQTPWAVLALLLTTSLAVGALESRIAGRLSWFWIKPRLAKFLMRTRRAE